MAGRSLDPYARPYIPQELIRANDAPASFVYSAPAARIIYEGYTLHFFQSHTTVQQHYLAAAQRLPNTSQDQPEELLMSNYGHYFGAALAREGTALQKLCDEHALYNVPLAISRHDPRPLVFELSVPGLREPTLPVETGDIVGVRQLLFTQHGTVLDGRLGAGYPPMYIHINAVVWGVQRQMETLSLRIDGLAPSSGRFNICFTVQAPRLAVLHGAIQDAQSQLEYQDSWLQAMAFPETRHGALQKELNRFDRPLDLYDEALNYEQHKAIHAITQQGYGRVPYLVSGPPGTGKTKTVVETTLQLMDIDPKTRLILCSPSDPACDTLIQRLSKHLNPRTLLRLNAPSRSFPEVPNTVLPFCHVEGEAFSLPSLPDIMKKRVVVVTCRDTAMLLKASLSNRDLHSLEKGMRAAFDPEAAEINPRLHWTGLIIDEAAQAMEPEAMMAMLVVAPPRELTAPERSPLVVMVGDQNQLGPRTASKEPTIQQSMFERLLRCPLYRDHPLARSQQSGGAVPRLTQEMLPIVRPPFTDLIRNYRSHPAIIATPSSLFYHDTLEPAAPSVDSLLPWAGFQGRTFPVLFVDNRSADEIEQDGGGWFNVGEADAALRCAQSFLTQGLLAAHEICIMSPFSAQVRVLRRRARSPDFDLHRLNIGPVEAFQGLESRLVILCTTRARDRFIDQDNARGFGIIYETRRFNVALTRAKEGLVVIGNGPILMQDENWASFMAFCLRNNAVVGDTDGWQFPHSSKIRRSRLEKQLAFREKVVEHESRTDSVLRKLGHLKLGMSEEEAFIESGIDAQLAVAPPDEEWDDETHDEEEARDGEDGTA